MSRKSKRKPRYISRNLLWVIAGLVLTVIFVRMAYSERGYVAYGGEWLTLPLVLMLEEVSKCVSDAVRYLFGTEDGYGPDEN